jgi:aminoglycoside/choline kinase family phosphotransferase
MERRSADDARARIDAYLASKPNARGAKVVPLTGDASDRRYFRILTRNEAPQVLAVHPGPIDFEALPFVNVAPLLSQMPVPVPRILGHSNELGIIALQDLGYVSLQAHLGAASPAQHAAL